MRRRPDIAEPSWTIRRIVVWFLLGQGTFNNLYLMVWAKSDPLREQLALGNNGLMTAVALGYIGSAAWDSRNHMNAQCKARELDRVPEPPEDDGRG